MNRTALTIGALSRSLFTAACAALAITGCATKPVAAVSDQALPFRGGGRSTR